MKLIYDGTTLEGTPEEIKEYFELLGVDAKPKGVEETPKFKKGDRARLLSRKGALTGFSAGDEVIVLNPENNGIYEMEIEGVMHGITGYTNADNLEKIVDETPSKPATIKRKARVGERILITDASSSGSQYDNGDILTVRKVVGKYGTYDAIQAEGVSIGIFDYEYEVIGEECAEAKRKPGEFKKGDIVRGERIKDASRKFIGEVENVGFDLIGVREYDRTFHAADILDCELIAPVEARVDGSFE